MKTTKDGTKEWFVELSTKEASAIVSAIDLALDQVESLKARSYLARLTDKIERECHLEVDAKWMDHDDILKMGAVENELYKDAGLI